MGVASEDHELAAVGARERGAGRVCCTRTTSDSGTTERNQSPGLAASARRPCSARARARRRAVGVKAIRYRLPGARVARRPCRRHVRRDRSPAPCSRHPLRRPANPTCGVDKTCLLQPPGDARLRQGRPARCEPSPRTGRARGRARLRPPRSRVPPPPPLPRCRRSRASRAHRSSPARRSRAPRAEARAGSRGSSSPGHRRAPGRRCARS